MGPTVRGAFTPSAEQIANYRKNGFVKLEGFFPIEVVDYLRARVEAEMNNASSNFETEFRRLKYDFETDKTRLYDIIAQDYFKSTLTGITGHNLFFTFELCFELGKAVSTGFPWHVGVQSFGYQRARDFGLTIWAPLDPIDVDGQRGGIACVPQDVVSGEFIFDQIEPALVSTLEKKIARGCETDMDDYFALRSGVLNSPTMLDVLGEHAVEENFRPGDVLLFNKYVVHKSVPLLDGPLDRRAAFVLRLVDIDSRYDLARANNLEFPSRQYGYKAFTRSHIEIGLADGDLIRESGYFDNREKRILLQT